MMLRGMVITCAVAALAPISVGEQVTITVENLLPSGGTALTPVFLGLHDGSFDLFNTDAPASPGLELVAELGMTGTLASEFQGAAGTGANGTTAGGPITGGTSDSLVLNPADTTVERYLTFASMIVPTNDLFIGNPNPLGFEVFDAGGNFNGPFTITIFGSQVWDAGTEENNADNGAAFLQGIDATQGTVQGDNPSLFFDDANAESYLDSLIGRTTAPGFVIGSTFEGQTAIAQITVVPSPATVGLASLVGGTMLIRRRRHT